MALRTPAHNFSLAQKRVGVTSKRRQCSCRTCQTVYCRATAPSSNLRVAISLPQGSLARRVAQNQPIGRWTQQSLPAVTYDQAPLENPMKRTPIIAALVLSTVSTAIAQQQSV